METTERAASRQTIVVAEDDILLRHVLAEYLRGCGFNVVEVSSALEARKLIEHGVKVYLLLADARLAGQEDGFALAQWVRRSHPTIRVMLTSTLANKSRAVGKICGKCETDTLVHDRMQAKRARGTTRRTTGT